jgi:RNA polymerase sigma factor, sigma-70 family
MMDAPQRRLFAGNSSLSAPARQELFESLWREWYPRLIVYLGARGALRAEDRDEIASDAILKAFEKAGTYDPERPFEPWIFALTRRLALDRLRSPALRLELPVDCELLDCSQPGFVAGPEEAFIRRESRKSVARIMEALPAKEREVAFLVYSQSMKLKDVSRITGESLGTVKWRLFRLRKLVGREMEAERG